MVEANHICESRVARRPATTAVLFSNSPASQSGFPASSLWTVSTSTFAAAKCTSCSVKTAPASRL